MKPVLIPLALATSLTGCGIISRPVVTTPPARCASLIPDQWVEGVEAAPIPENEPRIPGWLGKPLTDAMVAAIIAPWAAAYLAMDGQLGKANSRTTATIEIQTDCEAMMNEARPD